VDLLLRQNRQLIPIEIKTAMTFNTEFAKGIAHFQKVTSSAQKGYIVYAGDLASELANASMLNFAAAETIFL
tara:strand:- start:346 stop:561 length:216 start_codon:yes stop_codon:yes gene_type:complete